ncbi:MAG: response regulator transcription factor [Desulfococcaceae bacterium]
MKKIRVLIADDHEIVRTWIRKTLEYQKDMEVVDEAADGKEAVGKIQKHNPDVVLTDIVMPVMNGLDVIRQIRKNGMKTLFVILSIHKNDAYVYEAFMTGASAYLVKPCLSLNIVKAVRAVYSGDIFLSPRIDSEFIRCFLRNRTKSTEPGLPTSLSCHQ